jgi:hypothetical protein
MSLHLITICMGLIIAFGLQQLVELFQRRRRIRKQREAEARTPTIPLRQHLPRSNPYGTTVRA